ncbi:MAG: hypothetical protein JO108_26350, partial [Acidobacteriaceae bacterium]|nr:hypothetical protein [Acidobacteriaceae bacterium]
DGRLSLAPELKELDSTTVPYLWAVVQDSKGTLYYAGGAPTGATTKIFALPRGGKPRVSTELPGLEVHALAIDKQDRVYAAVLPDAKVYRIENGKPVLFFDPKCKYIWSMLFGRNGDLFLATGESGVVYRIPPDGKGVKFFETDETHARSMTMDEKGNLIIGTEPNGLIIRISPSGKGFVIYQAGKREVTAVAERQGVIYASAIGSKTGGASVVGNAPALPSSQAPVTSTGAPRSGSAPPSLPPSVGSFSATVTGGSEVYRIAKDGFAERIWSSGTDLVYAIAFDGSGKPLLGTGNKGIIYRVDSDQLSTQLVNTPPTQVTALFQGQNGVVYAATGNVGNIYSLGAGRESSGTLISEVLDANDFAYWGKIHLVSTASGGSILLESRSGNLNNPESNWSEWAKVPNRVLGGQIESPPARFLQYRLTLTCSPGSDSPEVSTVDIAWLPKNIAPKVGPIEIAPFNYRLAPSSASLERSVMPSGAPQTLSLPPVGQKKSGSSSAGSEITANSTLQYNKGFVTIRWGASDPNGDPLVYAVEIRGKKESEWRPVKKDIHDRYYSFDSASFADGEYVVRVRASDSPANTPADALETSLESDPFTIDNSPPEITNMNVNEKGKTLEISFTAKDALSWVDKAEYSIDGGDWVPLMPTTKVTDSQMLDYSFQAATGQVIAIRVFDENDNVVVKQVPIK